MNCDFMTPACSVPPPKGTLSLLDTRGLLPWPQLPLGSVPCGLVTQGAGLTPLVELSIPQGYLGALKVQSVSHPIV